mmetsp:Transcript_9052/g.15312  ORF Transcript_9052/g.15312 Transcript_9052/m.15312 type:complete len:255 (+) Transcript_9052:1057-1821(+)
MHIFTSLRLLGICGWLNSLSITMPWISSVSSRRPPALPSILIISKLTSFVSRLATESTASTAICAILRLYTLIILELRVVMAVSMRGTVLSAVNSTLSEMASRCLNATSEACSKPSEMRTGCRPFSRSFSACSSRAPASTVTPVVPSPISLSWDWDRSTNKRATQCSTSICCRIVAPSLVMVTSPSGLTSILSIPLGPREERRRADTDRAAMIFAFCASNPLILAFSCCSRRITKGLPYSSNTNDIICVVYTIK